MTATAAPRLAAAVAALMMASELKVRVRDPALALTGTADRQVYIELLAYVVVAAWLGGRRLVRELTHPRWRAGPRRELSSGGPLRIARALALLALVSSFWSPTVIAPIRAAQLMVLVELMAEIRYECRDDPAALAAFWRTLVALLVLVTGTALIVTLAPGGFTPFFANFQRISRFRLLAMHPVSTGVLLGVLLVVLGDRLLAGERWRSPGGRWAVRGSALAAASGVILTRERTPIIAAAASLLVLALLHRDRARAQLLLVGVGGLGLIAAVFFGSGLWSLFARGQTTAEVTSLSGRDLIFGQAWQLFQDRPLTGHGYLAGRSVFLPTIYWAGESHNVVVEIAVSSGIVGMLGFALLIGRWWVFTRAARRSGEPVRAQLASRSAGLIAFVAVMGVASDSFAGPPGIMVAAFLLALVLAELAGSDGAELLTGRRPAVSVAASRPDVPRVQERLLASEPPRFTVGARWAERDRAAEYGALPSVLAQAVQVAPTS